MTKIWFWLSLGLALGATPCLGAEVGWVTLLEGGARVLRGVAWNTLAEGARMEEGDIVEASERAQVQIELSSGGILNFVGPGALYLASLPPRDAKVSSAAEVAVTQGWLKLVAKSGTPGLRIRTPLVQAATNDAIVVLRCSNDSTEIFIESGQAKLSELGKAPASAPTSEARADEFWYRSPAKPLSSQKVPPHAFVGSMPRHFVDPLPNRLAKFQAVRVPLIADADVNYNEAAYWLSGPYRKAFVKRFQPMLKDAAFRQAIDANIRLYPEWDRILHPEKYVDEYGQRK